MRVAIIGLGAISVNHIFALKKANQEIVAICDIDEKKAIDANLREGLNAKVYTDYKEMLGVEKVDSVHICTPHYLHAEMIIYALSKNINVLCEKPLAINLEQLSEIKKAVSSSSAVLGVCQQNRYNLSSVKVKELIEGEEVISASGQLVWDRDEAYYKSGEWRGKWSTEGGGVMINQALHTLDLLQWFTGFPKYVTAKISNDSLKGVIEVEDTAYGLFELESGARFTMTATNASKYSFPVQIMLATKSKEIIILDNNTLMVNGEIVKEEGKEVVGKAVWGASHTTLVKDYYDKLKSGEKFPIDFSEAEKVVKLILAMYRSKGEKIEI